jgi:molybdopterin converting factor subunit 1
VKVTVLLFARPREVVGSGRLELEVEAGATPGTVFDLLVARAPRLAAMRSLLRCAVDQEYAAWSVPLHDGTELAFIPPTAGG